MTVKIDPTVDMKTPPKTQVDTMPAAKYFTYGAELLKLHPPHSTDQPIIARLQRIGIMPGKSLDIDKLEPAIKKRPGQCSGGRAAADEVEDRNLGPRRQWVVHEY